MTKPDQAAPTLSQEEIYHALLDLGWRIEACGASVELTNAVLLCSDIRQALGNPWNPADVYAARRVLGRTEISQTKAAPQPSTAEISTAPSQEGVGQGEVAGAAPLLQMPIELPTEPGDWSSVEWAHYGRTVRTACEQMRERASALQRDLDAANEKAHGYYCDLSTERDMNSRLTIIASDAQRERDLMAAKLKEIVENNDITVHEKHAEAIRAAGEKG